MNKSLPFLFFLMSAMTNTAFANTVISVMTSESNSNSINLTYGAPVRLQQVIKDSLNNIDQITPSRGQDSSAQKSIYWLSTGLYDQSSSNEFKIKKSYILEDLKTKYSDKSENINALNYLYTWVESQRFMRRILTPLDYDLIRMREEHNPLIAGDYLLKLHTKPDYITVLGAIEKSGNLPYRVNQNAAQYIQQAKALTDSDNSFAWLIQPDGHVEHYPIAYWNQRHIEIAPGAIIYLEFKGARKKEETLNESMLDLLKNWIY
jgi:hypothetical protein